MRSLPRSGRRWPASGSCERRRRSCRSRSASSVSRWPGWSGSSRATAGTPRCLRRGMTPLAGSRLAGSAAPRNARKRRNASGASSPARRDQRCAGRSRTTPATTTRRARANAARTWPARPISGWPGRSSSWRSPSRPRSGSSTTCTKRCAAAVGITWPRARRGWRTHRSRPARTCAPWPSTCWSSSTSPSSGAAS